MLWQCLLYGTNRHEKARYVPTRAQAHRLLMLSQGSVPWEGFLTNNIAPYKQPLLLTSLALTAMAQCPATPSKPLKSSSLTYSGLLEVQRVIAAADWNCRRGEIIQLFQTYESRTLPPEPQTTTGSLSGNTLSFSVRNGGQSISFPCTGSGAVPAIINSVTFSSLPAHSGVAIINFTTMILHGRPMLGVVESASPTLRTGQTILCDGLSEGHPSYHVRLVSFRFLALRKPSTPLFHSDVLESSGQTRIGTKRLGATGCSRNGKGASVVGALGPRITSMHVSTSA